MPAQGPASDRVRVRRAHERGRYDRATIDRILDASLIGHVGYVHDGAPVVTPTLLWRQDDHVYWHGSRAARYVRTSSRERVCVTVTHLDGLVLALSAFHHSANYRSVMLFGEAEPVAAGADTEAAMKYFMDKLCPGRWETLRPMTRQELKATSVVRLPIDEASAKIRSGPSNNEPGDEAYAAWSGVLSLRAALGEPEPDQDTPPGLEPPEHVRALVGRRF